MSTYRKENLLILTKTYPLPSANYREHTCVVAIDSNGVLYRLYPIPFRILSGDQQFKRWQWITAKITKASDKRPESHKIDVDSISLGKIVSTDQNWAERVQIISPHILESPDALEERRNTSGETIGCIKPMDFELIIEPRKNPDWTPKEIANLTKEGLFDSPEVAKRSRLKKVPFKFRYRFHCDTPEGKKEYNYMITDWEISMLFWNCHHSHKQNWEEPFRQKMEVEFKEKKSLIFLMGNRHRFQDVWLIVGIFYPPRVDARQTSFFPLDSNV